MVLAAHPKTVWTLASPVAGNQASVICGWLIVYYISNPRGFHFRNPSPVYEEFE